MNFRFVYHTLKEGGIEVYLVKLACELASRGHTIEVELTNSKGHSKSLIKELRASQITILYPQTYFHWLFGAFLRRENVCEKLIIVTFDWQSFCYSNSVYGHARVKLITGVYHIDEWNFSRWIIPKYLTRKIFSRFPASNFFVPDGVVREFSASHNCHHPPIVPVGISLPNMVNQKVLVCGKPIQIALVARIVGWKSFLYQVVDYLAGATIDYHLTIIGDGLDMASYKQYVLSKLERERVTFRGMLPLHTLYVEMQSVDCAVSVGTSAPILSSMGIPTIVGIENSDRKRNINYGWFSKIDGLAFHVKNANLEEHSFSLIGEFYQMTSEEIIALKDEHRMKASRFDLTKTTDIFLEEASQAKYVHSLVNICRLFICIFFINRVGPTKNRYWTRRVIS
ncbi:hypothetical protein N8490_00455 [bacterium]|nr:hypothetical protein [bacterium]MDB4607462.1 hypothetical protein [bacterium]MDC0304536.1 hypothetical protein [Akkermansiaceae bacterium]